MSMTTALNELAGIIETAGYSWGDPEAAKSYVMRVERLSGPQDIVNGTESIELAVIASEDVGMRVTRTNWVTASAALRDLVNAIRTGLLAATESTEFEVGIMVFSFENNILTGSLAVNLTY